MLEFYDCFRRPFAHVLDGVLIAEPVRPLHGVVHVPAPVVRPHVSESGADATLRGNSVASGWKQLSYTRRRQTSFGKPESRTQTGAPGSHHHDVVGVINELVSAHAAAPNEIFKMANTPAAATTQCANVTNTSVSVLVPPWT